MHSPLGCVFDTLKRLFLMDLCSNPKSKSHRQGLRKQRCSTARLSVLLKTVSSKSLGYLSKWTNQHQSAWSPSPKILFHVDTAVIRIVRRFGDTQGASSGTLATSWCFMWFICQYPILYMSIHDIPFHSIPLHPTSPNFQKSHLVSHHWPLKCQILGVDAFGTTNLMSCC